MCNVLRLKGFYPIIQMREVFKVDSDKKMKAEETLRRDEEINRGSIVVKSAASLDINEDCYFIIVDVPEDKLPKAKELLKDLAEIYKEKEKVLDKLDEQENSAIEGFGNILG